MTPLVLIVRVDDCGCQTTLREVYAHLARLICDGLGVDDHRSRARLGQALLVMAYCGGGVA